MLSESKKIFSKRKKYLTIEEKAQAINEITQKLYMVEDVDIQRRNNKNVDQLFDLEDEDAHGF